MFWKALKNQIFTTFEAENKIDKRAIIAIDGIDASGKTNFSSRLKSELAKSNIIAEIISIDDFHNEKKTRYKKGRHSPIGFYLDSYNYSTFLEQTIVPFKKQKTTITSKYFDLEKDKIQIEQINLKSIKMLIVEGIFLHRKELNKYWDYSIYLDITFEEGLKRNIERDKTATTNQKIKTLTEKYNTRYKAGQLIYLEQNQPQSKANLIIDNNDFMNPKICG